MVEAGKGYRLIDIPIDPNFLERYLLARESTARYDTGKSYIQLLREAGEDLEPDADQKYQLMLEGAFLKVHGEGKSWPTSDSPAELRSEKNEKGEGTA